MKSALAHRFPDFTIKQLIDAAVQMINPERSWSLITTLTDLVGVSCTLMYRIRNKTLEAIAKAVLPGEPGRPCPAHYPDK